MGQKHVSFPARVRVSFRERLVKFLTQVSLVALLGVVGCSVDPLFADPTILVTAAEASNGRFIVTLAPGAPSVTRALTVSNIGTCTFNFNANAEDAWLRVEPATGTIPAGGSLDLTVTISTRDPAGNNLAIGSFLGTLTLSGVCPDTGAAPLGSPVSVLVQINIESPDGGVAADSGVGVTDAGLGTADAGGADGG